jgi:hypothetical protein
VKLPNLFKRKTQELVVEALGNRIGVPLRVVGFRRGMWVRYQDITGILLNVGEAKIAHVMLVNDLGLNLHDIHVPIADLTQATFNQIPAPRRPDAELAVRLGYGA